MNISAAAEAMMRRKLLESIYDRMTDEEKRLFVQLTAQQKSADEIMSALHSQSAQLQDLRKHQQTFVDSFASNIAGNAVWSGLAWLAAKLFR